MALPRTQAELDEFIAIQAGKPGFILEEEIREAQEYLVSTPAKPRASFKDRIAVEDTETEQLSLHNPAEPEPQPEPTTTEGRIPTDMAETYVQDTLKIHGSAGGFPAEISVMMGAEDWEDPDFLVGLTARLENIGFGKPIAPVAVAAKASASSSGGGGGGGGNPGGNAQQGCDVHGMENARKGYQGRGMECGAFSDTKESWTRDKPYTPANGSPRWYCASKW